MLVGALLVVVACGGPASDGAAPTTGPTAPAPSGSRPATPAGSSPTPDLEDPLSPRPALESPAPLGQPTCEPSRVTVTDADAVITEQVEEVFVLRTSGPPCQLQGFPAVTLLDAAGRALRVPLTTADADPAPVSLSATTSLSFTLTTGRSGDCAQAASVRVVLPGTTRPVTAATELVACGGVEIGPVARLEDDEDEGAGH